MASLEVECDSDASLSEDVQCRSPSDTVSAERIEDAAALLDANDPCRKELGAWIAEMADLPEGQRPRKPTRLDERYGSSCVLELRKAAYSLAVQRWKKLHLDWLFKNDVRKRKARAERDQARCTPGMSQPPKARLTRACPP